MPVNRTTSAPELLLALARDGAVPLRAQLEAQVREAVGSGRLPAGMRLPSSRALAAELGVSRGVVVEAYGQLVAEGYLAVRRGSAPVVAAVAERRPQPVPGAREAAPRYDLRPGTPDLALFPRRAWAAAQRRALAEALDADLGYPDPAGHPALRTALAEYLGRVRGVDADPSRIVVCGGVAEVLALVARVLRARGAVRLAVETPSHHATRALLTHHGMQLVAIGVDEDGIDVAALAAADVDAVLVTPAHQFPTGVVLSAARRAALAAWARRTGALVIEDDYDAEYRYDRQPVGAVQGLAPEHVVHAHSVSKTLAPGLRLGWAVLPSHMAAEVAAEKRLSDLGTPVLEQLTLAAFLARGELDRHLRQTRPLYRRRREALLRELPELPAAGSPAGLHVLVGLPDGRAEADVVAAAAANGVAVEPLGPHGMPGTGGPALILGYSRLPEAALAEAARRLRAAIAR
ncbi:MocR-like pyridoxine biosynthesis transcription factor PdxR [Candidatus Solirubrobacter pratensis]|uniref:MocR-like pyridoxine biosynthesis transcription factor PdxR n=1 Tax=Candidatus Solirubrobacter pratensis TaxID=1298857 RepID=UPI00048629E9|nr:PLP-dependent aminotransferase family protein [Candidatus Solirubrobacter pratensis]